MYLLAGKSFWISLHLLVMVHYKFNILYYKKIAFISFHLILYDKHSLLSNEAKQLAEKAQGDRFLPGLSY